MGSDRDHMVPGLGSNINTGEGSDTAGEFPAPGDSDDPDVNKYGAKFLPAGEKNRGILGPGETLSALSKWQLPLNVRLADQLQMAGLVQDPIRGTTSSSARRESPSNVFGWSTPGPVLADSKTLNIGIDNSTLTRLIRILLKNGIVEKTANPIDKRSIIVSLLPKGESLQLNIEKEIDLFISALYKNIPMENREELKESLSGFHWAVTKHKLEL